MPVFVYPNSQNSAILAAEILEHAALPTPILWDHTCLDRTIRDLVQVDKQTSWSMPTASDIDMNVQRTGITDPVILFYGVDVPTIKDVIRDLKDRKQWPLLAVVTKSSLDMTLSCLIAHLLDDRAKELAVKEQRSKRASNG